MSKIYNVQQNTWNNSTKTDTYQSTKIRSDAKIHRTFAKWIKWCETPGNFKFWGGAKIWQTCRPRWRLTIVTNGFLILGTNYQFQDSASIQPRTDHPKFGLPVPGSSKQQWWCRQLRGTVGTLGHCSCLTCWQMSRVKIRHFRKSKTAHDMI